MTKPPTVTAVAIALVGAFAVALGFGSGALAQQDPHWVVAWTGSVQGPYPVGNPSAQPDQRFAFPSPGIGAHDQTFRLVVRPDIWGPQARLRFTNVFGTRPVTVDGAFVGLQLGGPAIVKGTNQTITFGGKDRVTIEAGDSAWSDAIALPFAGDAAALAGRRLAVSFHIAGESGPMTWHAKALTTSYVTAPDAGSQGKDEGETAFPYSTASWFFLDAIEVTAPQSSYAIVAFGDSITDGTASTMNGDDRWPDVLSRRLHATYGNRIGVVNAGIGGNQVAGPSEYGATKPFSGGPSAKARIDRDALDLSGVGAVILFEGINDFSKNGYASVDTVTAALKDLVGRIRERRPGVRVIGATVTSALGSSNAAHGSAEQDASRKALNAFIRTSGLFDGVVDFDKVTLDAQSGGLTSEFVPESTTGGAGDKLHPNRAGYLTMGTAVDLGLLAPK
jgi:lysophospholipase L1-like esterase